MDHPHVGPRSFRPAGQSLMILCTPVIYEEPELEGPCGKFAYGGAVPHRAKRPDLGVYTQPVN